MASPRQRLRACARLSTKRGEASASGSQELDRPGAASQSSVGRPSVCRACGLRRLQQYAAVPHPAKQNSQISRRTFTDFQRRIAFRGAECRRDVGDRVRHCVRATPERDRPADFQLNGVVPHRTFLSQPLKKIAASPQRGLLAATKAGISTPRHHVTKEKQSSKGTARSIWRGCRSKCG